MLILWLEKLQLNAEKLILLTDTPGILEEKDNNNSLVKQLNLQEAREFIKREIVNKGMRPNRMLHKSSRSRCKAAHIIDGRIEHSLLLEIFTIQERYHDYCLNHKPMSKF